MMHTPGPWFLYTDEDGHAVAVSFQRSQYSRAAICQMPVPKVLEWSAIDANGRLIAAAPDLLEACQSLENTSMTMAETLLLVRAAILKATSSSSEGRSPSGSSTTHNKGDRDAMP